MNSQPAALTGPAQPLGHRDQARIVSLSPAAQVHYDARRDCWVMLAPDCVLELNPVAHAIIGRLTGRLTTAQVVHSLAREYDAEPEVIASDVDDLLEELASRRLLYVRD